MAHSALLAMGLREERWQVSNVFTLLLFVLTMNMIRWCL